MDGSTSSKELLTIDRSNLANNLWFPDEYITGVSARGKQGTVIYHLGGYSAGEKDKEFGRLNAGTFGLASIGLDMADELGVKDATVRVDYVHQEADEGNDFTRKLANIGSLNGAYETKAGGARMDLSTGEGYLGQSDIWGLMLMPFFNLTEKLQGVLRYTHLESDDHGGVRLARYESEVVSKRGNEYDEYYAGLNYYVYGHKVKLQTGFTWAEMKDDSEKKEGEYDGWGWTAGLRVSW
jgi:phosphate-selective porin OprO and OprP